MKTSVFLQEARRLYASAPSHARRGNSPRPGTYCIVYATCYAKDDTGAGPLVEAAADSVLERVVGPDINVVDFNANHSTAEVLSVFDTAISYALAMEQEFDTAACTPVEFDRWTAEDVAEALGETPPNPHPLMDQAAWERAWKDMER